MGPGEKAFYNMIRSTVPDWARNFVYWGNLASSAVIGIAGLSLNFSPENLSKRDPILRLIIERIQDIAPWLIVLGATGILFFTLASKRASDARLWRVIHKLLDNFQESSCDDEIADHKHKVTLFEFRKWHLCWRGLRLLDTPFWSGWLVPVERSGRRNVATKLFFLAPDHDAHRAEGVAGMGWLSDKQHLLLGPLDAPTEISDIQKIREYASVTKVSEKVVKKYLVTGRSLPRTFFVHVIEVNSTPWGVLVLDSVSPAVCSTEKLTKQFRVLATSLEPLLSESNGVTNSRD